MQEVFRLCAHYVISFYSPARRYLIATEICNAAPSFLPGGILHGIRKHHGLYSVFPADLILFGWCAFAGLCIDLIPDAFMLLKDSLGMLCCLIAFSLCWDDELRQILKSAFICIAILLRMPWFATILFLIAFEHLVSHPSEEPGAEKR